MMKNQQNSLWYRFLVFVLILAICISVATPVCAEASDSTELYVAYQNTEDGTEVVKLGHNECFRYRVDELHMKVGGTVDLCFINAKNGWKSSAKWTSDNTGVATVNNAGVVSAVGSGEATITFSYTRKYLFSSIDYSTSLKVYVTDDMSSISIGFIPGGGMDTFEMKEGTEIPMRVCGTRMILNSNDSVYSVKWSSSASDVAEVKNETLCAKKAGQTTITAQITNNVTHSNWTEKVEVIVTQNAYSSDEVSWDNPYYLLYGENYKKVFSENFLRLSCLLESEMIDEAYNVMRGEMDKINFSAATLADVSNALSIAFEGMFKGKDYLKDEIHSDAALYLIEQLSAENSLLKTRYMSVVGDSLAKYKEIVEKVGKGAGIAKTLEAIKNVSLDLSESELEDLLGYAEESFGEVADILPAGITTIEYIASTICLYEAEGKVLDELQGCVHESSSLYKDIQKLKNARSQSPVTYYARKYMTKSVASAMTGVLTELAGSSAGIAFKAAEGAIKIVATVVGADELSEVTESTILMEYLMDIIAKTGSLQTEISTNYDSYSVQELMAKIEEYEMVYTTYLATIYPVLQRLQDVHGYNAELDADSLIPQNGFDYGQHIAVVMSTLYATGKDVPERKRPTVKEKIDQMLDKLGVGQGKTVYFTVNKKTCTKSGDKLSNHSCANCEIVNIITADWFKQKFGTITRIQNFPSHTYTAQIRDYSGQSCFGFACWAQWYVFADSLSQELWGKEIYRGAFTKNNVKKYVQPGDVLRITNTDGGGHSMLVYDITETGLVVVDSNWRINNQLNCVVQKHELTWNWIKNSEYKTLYVNRVKEVATIGQGYAGLYDVMFTQEKEKIPAQVTPQPNPTNTSVPTQNPTASVCKHTYTNNTDLDCNTCGYKRGYWSEWSEWQDTPISETSTCQVEKEENHLAGYQEKIVYKYSRWVGGGLHYPIRTAYQTTYQETQWLNNPLDYDDYTNKSGSKFWGYGWGVDASGTIGGDKYNFCWYNEQTKTISDKTNPIYKTQYRCRTLVWY